GTLDASRRRELHTSRDLNTSAEKQRQFSLSDHCSLVAAVRGHVTAQENLTCLYVDSNNLKKIPAEIGTLRRLERLTLSNNSLSSLPAEMGALQRLRSLHLANNSLTELPAPLCQLRSLTFLDVSDNKISLPEDVCLLRNLHTLWLGNNHLRSLPPRFRAGSTSRKSFHFH
uniref:Uncharacterized protein n=1 Tax=Cyanoderma ruficeps TaxID=181631 RepID=A0A8C3QSN0_9PASS